MTCPRWNGDFKMKNERAGVGAMQSMLPRVAGFFGLLLLVACGSDPSAPAADRGPSGAIIDVDAGSIPLGEVSANGGAGAGGGAAMAGKGGGSSGGGGSAGHAGMSDPHGLSTACESDADCSKPLNCHKSPTDFIANMQCGMYCDSDEDCSGSLGQDAFCIGANTCVKRCKIEADCAPRTHCNDYGWCERGGPGSGVPYCGGSATPCALLSDLQCIGASGCKDNSECSGFPPSCYSQFTSYSCTDIEGCTWSTYSKSCSGSAHPCSTYFGEGSCGLQKGCYWSGGCYGVAKACNEQFVSLCDNQPGCYQVTD